MKSLQECNSLAEAQPFLRGATPTFRKTVETAFALMNHPDASQRALGQGFLNTAIQEMDAAEQPTPHHDDGVKAKGEHFVKEAELEGGNKSGNDGSEQSSKNSEPVTSKEGTTEPEGDMEDPGMETENQFSEMGAPMTPPGIDPMLLKQMAPQMPQLPPMNTPQQIQQMQYTVKKYMEAYVKPLRDQVVALTKAQKYTTNQIKEITSLKTGLDLHSVERDLPRVQETTLPQSVSNVTPDSPRIYEKAYNLEKERQSIVELNKMVSSNPYQ